MTVAIESLFVLLLMGATYVGVQIEERTQRFIKRGDLYDSRY